MPRFQRLETQIEQDGIDLAESRGILVLKLNVWGRRGWPDRLFVYHGRAWFIEFKRPGEEPEPLQAEIHKRLRDHGMDVFVVDNLGDCNGALDEMCRKADKYWRA